MQRKKFAKLTVVASLLLSSIIKPLWDRFATGMSGYNAFISANRSAFQSNGIIDCEKVLMSRGRIVKPDIQSATIAGTNLNVTISNPTYDRFGLPTDRLYVIGADAELKYFPCASITSTTRGTNPTQQVSVPLTGGNIGYTVEQIWVGYVRADGSEVSTSGTYTL